MHPSVRFDMRPNSRNSSFVASLVIPTRNRKIELHDLLLSALQQSVPLEIIVMDDESTDGTAEMMKVQFPNVIFDRQSTSKGPAYLRNRGIELSTTNIVFPLDDDTLFVSQRTVAQTLTEFNHPRVGAVAVPFVNIAQSDIVRQRAPDPQRIYVAHAFVG